MSWKLYKPGQGYWTRLMSGIAGAVLVFAGGAWLAEKLSVIQGDTRVYIQAGSFVTIVVVFGVLIYRAVAASPRTNDFLIATEGEMKKVNWPSQKEVTGSTWVVIWSVILLTALIYGSDLFFVSVFRFVGILE